jgi:hypothetical protein
MHVASGDTVGIFMSAEISPCNTTMSLTMQACRLSGRKTQNSTPADSSIASMSRGQSKNIVVLLVGSIQTSPLPPSRFLESRIKPCRRRWSLSRSEIVKPSMA